VGTTDFQDPEKKKKGVVKRKIAEKKKFKWEGTGETDLRIKPESLWKQRYEGDRQKKERPGRTGLRWLELKRIGNMGGAIKKRKPSPPTIKEKQSTQKGIGRKPIQGPSHGSEKKGGPGEIRPTNGTCLGTQAKPKRVRQGPPKMENARGENEKTDH